MENSKPRGKYTCNDYREEMILLGLQKRVASDKLSHQEREELLIEIAKIEKEMGLN